MSTTWAKIIDQRRCIGCHACTIACKSENSVPLGVTRTFVKQVEMGVFPSIDRVFQVTRCNQCELAPCVDICPTGAMYQRPDGIVDFNRDTCIGCKACIAACPYDAIYIDPESHSAEKCNFCAHRIDMGLEPACVVVCPTQAIIVGDRNDPTSEVAVLLATEETQIRRPEKGTLPKLFYINGVEAALNPLAAEPQGAYATAEQQPTPWPAQHERLAMPTGNESSQTGDPSQSAAAAILTYGNGTRAPWDWRVSGYSWTKSIGSGTLVMAVLAAFFGGVGDGDNSWHVAVVALSATFTALTGALLIGDLSHPERFYMIFVRPRWGSWLVRGGWLIAGYSLVLAAMFISTLLEHSHATWVLRWAGVALAVPTAVYTAFLLLQAKGRDLWQDRLLPLHFLVRMAVAGGAALAVLTLFLSLNEASENWLTGALTISLAAHLGLVAGDVLARRPTVHAKFAAANMLRGRWAPFFWGGAALSVAALIIAISTQAPEVAGLLALAGLLGHEHAYIQAGQSVPQT